MNEKILALLAEKLAQARKDGLQQMARSLAIQAADETQAQALVEQLTADKVTDYIKEWIADTIFKSNNYAPSIGQKYQLHGDFRRR